MASGSGLARKLIINSIFGLVVLFLVNQFTSLTIGYLWWPLILSALGGIPGAILAIILHVVGLI